MKNTIKREQSPNLFGALPNVSISRKAKAQLITILALGLALLSSCNKESEMPETNDGAVLFTTAITRATGTAWDANDQIGIFMKIAGGNISTGTTLNAANVPYITDGTTFTTTTPIYYPQTGTVDFVAYYPWRTTPAANPYTYKVDVSTQTDPAAIDLLYSNNATDKTKSTVAVPLQFTHKLSKVELTVEKGAGMTGVDFTGMGVTIAGMPTTADFSLADGTFTNVGTVATITPRTVAAGAQYEAIIIPQAGSAGRTMVFTVGGESYSYEIPAANEFVLGKSYSYTITVTKTGISVSRGDITDWVAGGAETGTADPPYTVTMTNTDGLGTAIANPTSAVAGTLVEITAIPNDTYHRFSGWVVVGGGVTLSSTTANPATFAMPGNAVTIRAEFEPTASAIAAAEAEARKITEFTPGTNTTDRLVFNAVTSTPLAPGTEVRLVSITKDGNDPDSDYYDLSATLTNEQLSLSTQKTVDTEGLFTEYSEIHFTVTLNGVTCDRVTRPITSLFESGTTAGKLRADKNKLGTGRTVGGITRGTTGDVPLVPSITLSEGVYIPETEHHHTDDGGQGTIRASAGGAVIVNFTVAATHDGGVIFFVVYLHCNGTKCMVHDNFSIVVPLNQ